MRKHRTKLDLVLPLGIKNRFQTELPALVALTAIGEPWFSPQHQSDLLAVALVVGELATAGSNEAEAAAELQVLCEGEITMERKATIAFALAECLPWLQMQPNTRVQRALRTLMTRCLPKAA